MTYVVFSTDLGYDCICEKHIGCGVQRESQVVLCVYRMGNALARSPGASLATHEVSSCYTLLLLLNLYLDV